jgi:hypothetical protein
MPTFPRSVLTILAGLWTAFGVWGAPQESPASAAPTASGTLTITQAETAACMVVLNGQLVEPGSVTLQSGLNHLAVVASGTGWIRPELEVMGVRFPADERWRCFVGPPPTGWERGQGRTSATPVTRVGQGIWSALSTAPEVRFYRDIYVPEAAPRAFPRSDRIWLPQGSRQLIKLYLPSAPGVSTEGYALRVETPQFLKFIAADGMDGVAPRFVRSYSVMQPGNTPVNVCRADFGSLPGSGFELSLCWARADGSTLFYQPAIRAGGTFDWKRLSAKVRAPADATAVRPLVIKWQDRAITGTFWVDNLAFAHAGSFENLLPGGDLEDPAWKSGVLVAGEGRDGSRGIRIVATEANVANQQAMWVPPPGQSIPVDAGTEYTVSLDVKARDLRAGEARPCASLLYEVAEDAPLGECTIKVGFETEGGAVSEVPQPVTATILPPLLEARPKRIRIEPCYYSDMYDNPQVLDAIADNVWRSGINANYGGADNELVRRLRARGDHHSTLSIRYTPWTCPGAASGILEERPDIRALEFPDKASKQYVCPTWLLSEGVPVLKAIHDAVVSQVDPGLYQSADWDYEYPVVDPPTICFCPRCLAAFRKSAGLPAGAEVTPQTVVDRYREAWVSFRCRQNADLAAHIRDAVRDAAPGVSFSMYSGFESLRTREHYGVDWALLAPLLDEVVVGYGGDRDSIRATVKASAPTPVQGGEMWYLSPTSDARPASNPLRWRNRLLRQCLESGGHGVLIWYLPTMDGGAYYYTSEAAAVLARHEDLIYDAQHCASDVSVEGLPDTDWFALERNGQRLLLLLNFSPQDQAVRVQVHADWRNLRITDPVTGDELGRPSGLTFDCPVPAYGVRAVLAQGR